VGSAEHEDRPDAPDTPRPGRAVSAARPLAALAAACAEDGRYAFLFTAPPLPITGAVGSPINPLAIK